MALGPEDHQYLIGILESMEETSVDLEITIEDWIREGKIDYEYRELFEEILNLSASAGQKLEDLVEVLK